MPDSQPLVAVVMGSQSDWATMKNTRDMLDQFGISCVCRALSAHRTPEETVQFIQNSEEEGVEVFIAAAGGAAHLAGVVAAHTVLPGLGVPMVGWSLDGLDSLLATVPVPRGIPVGTLAIGKAGAVNAALLAVSILAGKRPELKEKLLEYRQSQKEAILNTVLE